MKDVMQTVCSQYANSPTMMRLIHNMNEAIRPDADIDNFYDVIWNVKTAIGFGLDIWGRIVGISRILQIPSASGYFGFQDGASNASFSPFGVNPFFSGINASTSNYSLSDAIYRPLIMAKALANISSADSHSINQILQNAFPGVRCYVVDQGNMQMMYVFESVLTVLQKAIVQQSGVVLKPSGVGATVMATTLPVFGFSEMGTVAAAPFGQAPFISEDAIYEL